MPQILEHGEIETVVRSHAGWVHACASRRVGSEAMAEDVTQAVFILLWRRRGRLREGMKLTGWLYRAVRYCAADALRDKRIRERHEREAAMARSHSSSAGEATWTEVSPELEQAVDRLGERDRSAVLLRFYRQMSYAEVGQCMGISEEAARKRVERAVEKLRGILGKKGVAGTKAGLSAVLVGNVVGQMPEHLVEKIISAVGSTVAAAIAKGAMKMMTMAKVKVVGVGLAVAVGLTAAGVAGTRLGPTTAPAVVPAIAANAPATQAIAVNPATANAADLYRQAFAQLPHDERDKEVFSNWSTAAFDGVTADVLGQSQESRSLLLRAATLPNCDWQMAPTPQGINTFMPDLANARACSLMLALHARQAVAGHRNTEAIDDLATTVAMARHLDSQPILISHLTATAVEALGIRCAAMQLPLLQPEDLKTLAARLNHLPPPAMIADCMRAEKKLADGMLRAQGQPGMLPGVTAVYDQVIQASELPGDEFNKAFAQLQQRAQATAPLAATVLPSIARARESDAIIQTMRVMLRAAIAVQASGPKQLELPELRDPADGQPFGYQKIGASCFALTSKMLTKEGKPLELPIGVAGQ